MSAKRKRIVLVCGAVMVIAVGVIIFRLAAQRRAAEVYQDLQQTVSSSQPSSSVSQPQSSQPEPEPEPEPELEPSPIDFEALQEINPEAYAWVEIPDTEINYPILQHTEDNPDYYLNYSVENVYGYPGSIFSQPVSPKDFSAFNTILYGHDAPDGTMFGSLEKYRDEAYLQEHPEVFIYTPEGTITYKIFAAVVYSNKLIPYYFQDDDMDDRQAFLDSLSTEVRNMNNHILEDVEVTPDDQILTLSTCIGLQEEYRYLVVAVRQDDEVVAARQSDE